MKTISLILFAITGIVSVMAQQPAIISSNEKEAITYMREEEKLARDVYDSMYAKWAVNPFGNIRFSEQTHMNKMNTLIKKYQLENPVAKNDDRPGVFTNNTLQQLYDELTSSGSRSLTDALRAGAKIEELDITDLHQRAAQTKQPDILTTYQNLTAASENHLRAFVRRLSMQGVNYTPVILSQAEFDEIIAAAHKETKEQGCGGCK